MPKIPQIYIILIILVWILLLFNPCSCFAEDSNFQIQRIGKMISFEKNAFRVDAPEAGNLIISIHDSVSVYRTLEQHVGKGETIIDWDGCGYNREKLYEKVYTVTAILKAESGLIYEKTFQSPMEYSGQSLQFALPSGNKVSLSAKKEWFVEIRTIMKGTVVFEFHAQDNTAEYQYKKQTDGGRIHRFTFASITGKKPPKTGNYRIRIYEQSKPDIKYEFDLLLTEKSETAPAPFETGPVLPGNEMNDSEIWELMMKPSVVIDIDFFKHQSVYKEPNVKSDILGTLHGQTQALEVKKIENEWSFIGAWNHEEAEYVEGWVPTERLKVVEPSGKYGLLIDKKTQTLSVFQNGKKIDTLLVSTGRMDKNRLYQESSAGSFLTGYHRVDFSTNGKKYDYVIQYDGGNMIHQLPYEWGTHKQDFTIGRGYLGAKASHACIRVQSEPGEGGLNAYWIWTHLPYHTRVIILDDPQQRRAEKQVVQGVTIENTETEEETPDSPDAIPEEHRVSLCIAGFAGTEEIQTISVAENEKKDGLQGSPALPERLMSLFPEKSITCVIANLSSPSTEEVGDTWTQVIDISNPVQTILSENHTISFVIIEEKKYLKDPRSVSSLISSAMDENQKRIIIAICLWEKRTDRKHDALQEAMAHACIRAGADAVIGNCPDLIQGIQLFQSKPIIYSLGNLYTMNRKNKEQSAAVLNLAFDDRKTNQGPFLQITPIFSGITGKGKNNIDPVPAEEENGLNILRQIQADSTVIIPNTLSRLRLLNQK